MTDASVFDEASPVILQKLAGDEGGIWRVITRDSSYLVDLDCGTITRIPGPMARSGVNDRARPLRLPMKCVVAERGYWEMDPDPDEPFVDVYYQHSSLILRIERLPAPPEVR